MIIKMFTFGLYLTNCYIVGCEETKEAVVIDPGFNRKDEANELLKTINQLGLNVKYIINTHSHPDHTAGNGIIIKETGATLLIHSNNTLRPRYKDARRRSEIGSHVAHNTLKDGDVIQVGRIRLKVLHTPGHSGDGISLLGDDVVFTGDTLFAGSIGRSDFPGASFKEIMNSINTKLVTLPDHFLVYPGHGPPTTIGNEKRYNPFLLM